MSEKAIRLVLKAKDVLTGMPGPLNGNKLSYTHDQKKELARLDSFLEEVLIELGAVTEELYG